MSTKASLNIHNKESQTTIELDIKQGTLGTPILDISPLASLPLFTFDPGFRLTASCESKITYIDGNQGILLHRGYPIEQLAEQSHFLETCYLLLNGELPTKKQIEKFTKEINQHTIVHTQLSDFFKGFRRDAHPMAIMCGVVGALSAFYHDALDIHDAKHRKLAAIRLIAKLPTLAAMCYKYSIGQPFV